MRYDGLVFRVENEHGRGPFRPTEDGEGIEELIAPVWEASGREFLYTETWAILNATGTQGLAWGCDRARSKKDYLHGTNSLEELALWFRGVEDYLKEEGFRIVVYVARRAYRDRVQAVFHRKKARPVKTLDIDVLKNVDIPS